MVSFYLNRMKKRWNEKKAFCLCLILYANLFVGSYGSNCSPWISILVEQGFFVSVDIVGLIFGVIL